MELEKNVESDEFMPEVYQQFLCYQKKVNKRFQEMEGMLGLAAQQLEKLKVRKAKRKNTKFDNPIVKSKVESSKEVEPEPLHHLKLRFPKFEGAEVFECSQDYEHQLVAVGIRNKTKEWPNLIEEGNVDRKELEAYQESPRYNEVPGEDKEDWHYEELICIALGLEDFFQPKQNFEDDNFGGAKVLECTSDFRIKPREMTSDDAEEQYEPTESGPEFQMPKDLIASTKLDKWRLQPSPCFILKCQYVNSSKAHEKESKAYDKETGRSQQHFTREIQVNYKITSDEAKGMMQLLIGGGQASETSKVKRDHVTLGAQNHYISESGTVGKFPREKLEFLCVNHLIQCSPCSSRNKLLLDMNSKKKTILVEGGDGLTDSIDVIKEEGARKTTEICTNEISMELVANIQVLQQCEEVTSTIPTSRNIVEAFHIKRIVKDFPTAETFYDLGMRSSDSGKENILIFDPGGQVQNKQSKGVENKFKDMFRSEVKLEEAVMKISVGGQLRPWEDLRLNIQAMEHLLMGPSQWQWKVFSSAIGNTARLQGQSIPKVSHQFDNIVDDINQQYVYSVGTGMIVIPYMCTVLGPGSLENARRLEDHDFCRKRVLITIFDPGGYIICGCDVQLVSGTTEILHSAIIASGEKKLEMQDPP